MTLLSIDPGKRIGYALFTDAGGDIERGVIQFDDWFTEYNLWVFNEHDGVGDRLHFRNGSWKHSSEITQLVVEGYRHDPLVQQGGSLHEASQIIGSVKTYASISDTPIAVQYSRILPVAMLHAGYEPPVTKTGKKKHLPDEDSAWLHGRYWLTSQGVL